MRRLPLYPDGLAVPLAQEVPHAPQPGTCTACDLHTHARVSAMPAEGTPGGLLVVGGTPGATDSDYGRPFAAPWGSYVRDRVQESWTGPVVYDNALRCHPPRGVEVKEKHVDACRRITAAVVRSVVPQRIVALGATAALSLLGRKVHATKVRRAVGWWVDPRDTRRDEDTLLPLPAAHVPVFVLPDAADVLRNAFKRSVFERDLAWALRGQPPALDFLDAVVGLVESVEDADECLAACAGEEWLSLDTETSGVLWESDFRVECLTVVPKSAPLSGFVFDRAAIEHPAIRQRLIRLLVSHRFVGANLKYDVAACRAEALLRVRLAHHGCVRLWGKALNGPESSGKLAELAEYVGMGGHKEEAGLAVAAARVDLVKLAAEPGLKPLKPTKRNPTGARPRYVPSAIIAATGTPEVPERTLANLRAGRVAVDAYAYRYMPADVRARYCARDTVSTALLALDDEARIAGAPHVAYAWDAIQRDLAVACARIEEAGVRLDVGANDILSAYCRAKVAEADIQCAKYLNTTDPAEVTAVLNSPARLAKVLYDDLRLPRTLKTDSGADSTAAEALDLLKHPFVDALRAHRKYVYMDSHYGAGLRAFLRADGRLHASYLPDGTGTGRPSATDPNLNNIPSPDNEDHVELGKLCRAQFVAAPGCQLGELDQSQIELRVLASRSGDPLMLEFYNSGKDFHMQTARTIAPVAWKISEAAFDALPADQQKVMRRRAKTTNFSLAYGKTAPGLAADLGCSVGDAQRILDAVLGKFRVLAAYLDACKAYGRKHGGIFVQWQGKNALWRPLPNIAEQGGERAEGLRRNAENACLNCLDAETEALTGRGWVRGFDLKPSDVLLTKNPTTGALEWQTPTDLKFWPDHEGEVYEFRSKSFHAVTTPGHRWLVWNKSRRADGEVTSETISKHGDDRIHRTGVWPERAPAYTDDQVELAGWFLTDGSYRETRRVTERPGKRGPKPREDGAITLFQSQRANAAKVLRIDALIHRLGVKATRRVAPRTEMVTWRFRHDICRMFPTRELTMEFVQNLTLRQATLLLETMIDGDGCRSGSKTTFVTRSRASADAFQFLCVVAGKASSLAWRDMSKYQPKSGKLLNTPVMTGVWQVTVLRRDKVQVTAAQTRVYRAKVGVWCPIVPNTFFVARRSGHTFITGNTPIQGEAAFYTNVALNRIWNAYDDECLDARVVMTVYDSIMVEAAEADADAAVNIAREVMLAEPLRNVPLAVDVKRGYTWASLT